MANPTPKTKEQIEAEIAKLKEIKPKVRRWTSFGGDNHAAIDAQIEVLSEDMDNGGIWDKWPDEENDMHVRDSALEARQWLDGDTETIADDWKPLIVKV